MLIVAGKLVTPRHIEGALQNNYTTSLKLRKSDHPNARVRALAQKRGLHCSILVFYAKFQNTSGIVHGSFCLIF